MTYVNLGYCADHIQRKSFLFDLCLLIEQNLEHIPFVNKPVYLINSIDLL